MYNGMVQERDSHKSEICNHSVDAISHNIIVTIVDIHSNLTRFTLHIGQ